MKALIVDSFDTGGAAMAFIRMHKGLLDSGVDSTLLLKEKTKPIKNSAVCPKRSISLRHRLSNKFKRLGVELRLISTLKKIIFRNLNS